jgi:hypothetical protein
VQTEHAALLRALNEKSYLNFTKSEWLPLVVYKHLVRSEAAHQVKKKDLRPQ